MVEEGNQGLLKKVGQNRPPFRQYGLFRLALFEKYGCIDEDQIIVDHAKGASYYKDIKYAVIFPRQWFDRVQGHEKIYDFVFLGSQDNDGTNSRDWVLEYENENSIIKFSSRGRTLQENGRTSFFDPEYFDPMMKTKFVLCPGNTVPEGFERWNERFYETIMCNAIPILKKGDIAPDYKHYTFYYHNDKHEYKYDLEIVQSNLEVFQKRNLL